MFGIARLLPLALAVGGVGVASQSGGGVVEPAINAVRSVLVQYELGTLAGLIELDFVASGRIPHDNKELAATIRENMATRGDRDPTLDLWEHPYRISTYEGAYVLLSDGANGHRDHECQPVDPQYKDQADDICVRIHVTDSKSGGGGGGGDAMGLSERDLPFRRIKK